MAIRSASLTAVKRFIRFMGSPAAATYRRLASTICLRCSGIRCGSQNTGTHLNHLISSRDYEVVRRAMYVKEGPSLIMSGLAMRPILP